MSSVRAGLYRRFTVALVRPTRLPPAQRAENDAARLDLNENGQALMTDFAPGDRVRSTADISALELEDLPGVTGTVRHVNTYDGVRITVDWDDHTNSKVNPNEIEHLR